SLSLSLPCPLGRCEGINSSLILYHIERFSFLFSFFASFSAEILSLLYKFDYYLEMVLFPHVGWKRVRLKEEVEAPLDMDVASVVALLREKFALSAAEETAFSLVERVTQWKTVAFFPPPELLSSQQTSDVREGELKKETE